MNIEVLKLLITIFNLCIVPFLNGGIINLIDSQKKKTKNTFGIKRINRSTCR